MVCGLKANVRRTQYEEYGGRHTTCTAAVERCVRRLSYNKSTRLKTKPLLNEDKWLTI